MNCLKGEINNPDGTIETLIIESSDNSYPLDRTKTYRLANYKSSKQNKFASAFKNSIFGAEIGIKAEGFSNIAILATILAVGLFITMYITFRI